MSFIKIKDPRKREAMIKDLIETRKRIKDNFIARKVGESEYQSGLTKLFKPVTETQKATAKEITEAQKAAAEKITSELLPIKEGLEKLPAITFPAYPSLEMPEEEVTNLGPIATDALTNLASKKGVDKVFGLTVKNKKFHIGNKPIIIKDNDIIVDGVVYSGTPGLWEVIISTDPKDFTEDDYVDYINLVLQTDTIYRNNNPNSNHPKNSKSDKWKNLISPIWDHIQESKKVPKKKKRQEDPSTSGTGLMILPNDPNALLERLDLLIASQNAGHTGVRNELVSILDVLKRQGVINMNTYKKLNSIIKK